MFYAALGLRFDTFTSGHLAWGFMTIWFFLTLGLFLRVYRYGYSSVNPHLWELLPGGFNIIGLFGTFLGITAGLIDFDTHKVQEALPRLLEGLRLAFTTSIVGISLGLGTNFLQALLRRRGQQSEGPDDDLLQALHHIAFQLQEGQGQQVRYLENIYRALSPDSERGLVALIGRLRQDLRDNLNPLREAFDRLGGTVEQHLGRIDQGLHEVSEGIGGDGELSLLGQLTKLREEHYDVARDELAALGRLGDTVKQNGETMEQRFREFGEALGRHNVEALTRAIEEVIGGFNQRLGDLLERLVQENFAELNRSVERLNTWQQQHAEQVQVLTEQFSLGASTLERNASTLEDVGRHVEGLAGDGGKLAALVLELESVLGEQHAFVESVQALHHSSTELQVSSGHLSSWMEQQRDLGQEVGELIVKLREIEDLRDAGGRFWSDVKEQLDHIGESLKKGSEHLGTQIQGLEDHFYNEMNSAFDALSRTMQTMVIKHHEKISGSNGVGR